MRRFRDRRPASYFRGNELTRMLTLVVMLGVLLLLMDRARDPSTWRWLAPGEGAAQDAKGPILAPERIAAGTPLLVAGPSDLDPAELDAAREELAAVADKVPLGKEEMPAYWRLMGWTLHQSPAAMQKRANENVTFRDLWHDSARWRGKLVEIRVHLRRTAAVAEVANNPLDLKSVDEVWGWNSDSQPNWFWMVVPELPADMPRGESIYEEGTFVGYFLKLLPYEDRQGKTLATPLLIGRLVWHPAPDNPLASRDEWRWTWYVAGALVALFAVRWGIALWGKVGRRSSSAADAPSHDEAAVEAWLDAKEATPSEQISKDILPFDLDDDPNPK